ncbi:MAG TPA: glycerophosphodiester phosphodiesterase [Ruminococcaceae bacterium]|nr:glycerophosphodiester phosphodiesterase [Oscillospiraceae bacterium]
MHNIKVWAHRGASGYAPENTLEAFKIAADQQADGVELDIQLTKDGELVVIHDEVIDRVSSGSGLVKDYTLKELKSFNFNKTHPEFAFTEIPTLQEVYCLLKNTSLTINVELKTGVFFYEGIEEKAVELARKMNMQDRIIYSSFNHYSVVKIKMLEPTAKTGFLYTDGFINMPQYARLMGADAIHPPFNNLKYPNLIDDCKKNNILINVWNIWDENIRNCCEMGVNAVITNYPDRTKKLIMQQKQVCNNG